MSDKTKEPIAAILAEMKRENRPYGISPDRLRSYADRIERANVRALALLADERAQLETKVESERRWANEYFDLARRREDALVHCRKYAQKIERENEDGETRLDAEEIIATVDNEFAGIRPKSAPGNVAALRDALADLVENIEIRAKAFDIFSIVDKKTWLDAKAALAAPARNCDRFQTELDAQLAFLNDVWLISVEKETMLERDKFENWTEQMKTCYGRWLLAPTKKGGAE